MFVGNPWVFHIYAICLPPHFYTCLITIGIVVGYQAALITLCNHHRFANDLGLFLNLRADFWGLSQWSDLMVMWSSSEVLFYFGTDWVMAEKRDIRKNTSGFIVQQPPPTQLMPGTCWLQSAKFFSASMPGWTWEPAGDGRWEYNIYVCIDRW